MHPHGVEVLHVADGDAGVRCVAHHLVLDLFPPHQCALDQHLRDRRPGQPLPHDPLVLLRAFRDAAAGAAERVGGADHHRQAHQGERVLRLLPALHDRALRGRLPDALQEVAEQPAILGQADRLHRGAEQAHAVAVQHARVVQLDGQVEAGLAAQGGQQPVRALALDDALDDRDRERLDIDDVCDVLVGHDRGRVGVDQHRGDALFAHRLARLRAGVVEFRRLADHDRPAADDQDFFWRCLPGWWGAQLW